MKSPEQVLGTLERRLERTWAPLSAGDEVTWSARVPLGGTSSTGLAQDFAAHAGWARDWFTWAQAHHVDLDVRTRRVAGTEQRMPVAVLVPDAATAARLLGGPWPDRLARAGARAVALRGQFPHLAPGPELTGLVRAVADLSDLDFDLLCQAGAWFAGHDGRGLTPRQVPIGGMHAKWLNTRQHLVRVLAGRAELGLAPGHPPRVHFTYLDPGHLADGGRRHDSHTLGDLVALAYVPDVVVICENKDTVVTFPAVARAVAVEGNGRGPGAIPDLPWVQAARLVVYWGDMDADGLEILAEFRAAGLPATSLLMDEQAYAAWSRFGTNLDRFGRDLAARNPRPTPYLTAGERALYLRLCDPSFTGHRRVEQERIPLQFAAQALVDLLRP